MAEDVQLQRTGESVANKTNSVRTALAWQALALLRNPSQTAMWKRLTRGAEASVVFSFHQSVLPSAPGAPIQNVDLGAVKVPFTVTWRQIIEITGKSSQREWGIPIHTSEAATAAQVELVEFCMRVLFVIVVLWGRGG